MKYVFKRFVEWIKKLFSNKGLESTEQTYWVNHICDEYVNASQNLLECMLTFMDSKD